MIALHLEANLKTVEQVGTTPYLGTRVESRDGGKNHGAIGAE